LGETFDHRGRQCNATVCGGMVSEVEKPVVLCQGEVGRRSSREGNEGRRGHGFL
jgi:hypothetical protein